MEDELLNLVENHEEMSKFLQRQPVQEVVSAVTRCVQLGKTDAVLLIKCILRVANSENSTHMEICTKLYTKLFEIIQKNEINVKVAFSIISLLLIQVDSLQTECLAKLARFFVESIKDGSFTGGKAADILPKILSVIANSKEIHNGEDSVKGSEFKGHIINSLCSSRWKPSSTVVMATLFHDIPLTVDELKFVLNKIIRMFPEIELSDQPALVFQLLQLSSKGHKSLVLEGITNFYKSEDDKNRGRSIMIDSEDLMSDETCLTTLRHVEGTVILHIVQAVKQDQELGRELIKYFKVLQLSDALKTIAPFNLSLLLSVSQLHHCEDQIFDFVKTTIFKCIQDEMRQKRSLWIEECFQVGIKTTDLVLEAVDHSTYDWDHVIQSLVQLGFDLMESYGPRLIFGQMSEVPTPDDNHMTPQQLACKLGRRVLLKIFKAHEVVRTEILDQIFKNIITRSTQPVTHYLDLLSDTVHSAPQLLLESSSKIQQVIIELAHLPPTTAQTLLSAVQPLLKLSPLLKDSLLLVLRKAMFSRQLDARKIGAMGFLTILKNFRVVGGLPSSQVSQPFALSQIQVEVHAKYNAASNEALCLEILGNLRRCFTQQADVRLNVYQGLYEVLHRNSQLRNPVLDMLLSQVKKYYEQDEDNSPPLRLEPCIQLQGEQVYLLEPLSHLLRCTQQCVRKGIDIESQMARNDDDDDDDIENGEANQSFTQLKSVLASLVKRMVDVSLEDFELDKSSDFNLTSSVGVKNNIYAILLLGIYEILMEYVAETGNFSSESCTQISQLFSGYYTLASLVKDKMAGKKSKPCTSKTPISLMSVHCVINLLKAFIDNHNTAHEEGIDILGQSKDLFPHLVSVALQKLEQVAAKGFAEGELRREENVFKECCTLGRLFYLHYVEHQIANDAARDRDKNTTSQCLEALGQVISIASSKGDQAIFHCLSCLEKDSKEEEKEFVITAQVVEKVDTHIKKMQRLIATILNESHEHQNWKEMSTLLSIISQLAFHLSCHSEQFQQTHAWVLKVCTDESVEDASCCKLLISILLTTGKKTKSLPLLLLNICQDLHTQFGHIDKDCEVVDKTHYSVTKSNCCPPSAILMLVLAQMDVELDDIDWVIKKHKAMVDVSALEEENIGATQMEQMDRFLCTRLGMLVNGFIELCHSAITSKINSHALLKSLTKLYTTLSNLAKYFLGLYTSKSGHMGSRFEKLINLVGRQLTQPAYCIISYVQMAEIDKNSHDGEKKDKGKKEGANAAQSGMAKAMKQMKTTSNLIFAMEQLEKFLIQLSKRSKMNLMEGFKLSTSRDFRINAEITTKAVDEGVTSSEEESQSNQEESREAGSEEESTETVREREQEEEPPAKKSKLGGKKTKSK